MKPPERLNYSPSPSAADERPRQSCLQYQSSHLLLVFLKLFLQFLGFALGVFEFLAHLHILQVQLGKFLLLTLDKLGQLGQFPSEGKHHKSNKLLS